MDADIIGWRLPEIAKIAYSTDSTDRMDVGHQHRPKGRPMAFMGRRIL